MAKRKNYGSFTPKRRAALAKAQAASARKRRRRNIAIGVGATTVLATTVAAGYVGHRYTQALKGGPKRPHIPAGPGKELVHVPGHGVTYTRVKLARRQKRGNPGRPQGKKVISVNGTGVAVITGRNAYNPQWRENYNQRRNESRGKHLPGKKGVVSTRGSRLAGAKRSKNVVSIRGRRKK